MASTRVCRLIVAGSLAAALAGLIACGDTPTAPTSTTSFWTLRVTVVDELQRAVAGAVVRVLDGINAGRVATSDASGVAVFEWLAQSGFTIEVTAMGFTAALSPVTLTAPVSVTVALRRAGPNTPPVISSIVAQGSRPNQPANMADLGESLAVIAAVQDAETPPASLGYEWTASCGSVSGAGPSVSWRAPLQGPTPTTCLLALTVVEPYLGTDDSGAPVPREHRVSTQVTINVHDSVREVVAMAEQFMADFSNSQTPPEVVLRNFSDQCGGKPAELEDVRFNRANYVILSASLSQGRATINFGGICSFRSRPGDACAQVDARWKSQIKATGQIETVEGTDHMTAVYERPRWWLCDSDFDGKLVPSMNRFIR